MADEVESMFPDEQRIPKVSGEIETQLHKDEIAKIAEYFNSKSNGGGCEVCGEKSWFPFPFLTTATIFNLEKNGHEHGRVLPFVLVGCRNCGNTKQFYASHLGITTPGLEKAPGEGK